MTALSSTFGAMLLGPDTHTNRPATAVGGTVYNCTTHNKLEKYVAGTGWVDWVTLGSAATFTVQDENTDVSTAVTQIDFQGAGVTATAGTGEVVVTIPGGGSSGDASWVAPTLQNGWVNFDTATYPPVGYRKDGSGFVHLRGLLKSGTFQAASFTLPAGYRPSGRLGFAVPSNGALGQVNVYTTGDVALNIGSNSGFFLDGITFYADA